MYIVYNTYTYYELKKKTDHCNDKIYIILHGKFLSQNICNT